MGSFYYLFLCGTGSGGGEISIDEISGGGNSEYFGGGGKSVWATISAWRCGGDPNEGGPTGGGVGFWGVPIRGGVNRSGEPLGDGIVFTTGGG